MNSGPSEEQSVFLPAVPSCLPQSNSYKGKHFIGTGLQNQRFTPLSSWWGAWQCAGRHGAREGAESSMWIHRQQKETVCHTGTSLSIYDLKDHPHNGTLPPTRPHPLIVPLPMDQTFKHMSLRVPSLFKPPQAWHHHSWLLSLLWEMVYRKGQTR